MLNFIVPSHSHCLSYISLFFLQSGLCVAELASCLPLAGGTYSYAYATMGELPAFLVGWSLLLSYV